MKRDMDLVRTILLEIEESQNPRSVKLQCHGYSQDEIQEHLMLLVQAKLIKAREVHSLEAGTVLIPQRLTWHGHEFIESTRNEGIWQKVKAEIKDRGTSLPFSLIQDLALKILAKRMGLPDDN